MPWVKGQSGNPAGRPSGAKGLARLIRKEFGESGEKLLDHVTEMMGAPETPLSVRLQCVTFLARCGWGAGIDEKVGREVRRRHGDRAEDLVERAISILRQHLDVDERIARRVAVSIVGVPEGGSD